MDAGHEVRRLEAADQRGKHRRSDDKVDDAINIHRHQDAGPGGGDHRVAAADQFTHANQRLGAGRNEGNQGYIDSGGEELQRRADALLSQLQPSRQCIEEAQKLYKTARKRRRSVAAITPRLEQHRQRLASLEASLTYLEQADSLEQVGSLVAELEALLAERGQRKPAGGRQKRRAGAIEGGAQPLELNTPSGLPVQIGRNHRQNEWIAFRQARRGDLWFHAQELPGSHVVLKSSERPASDADLQAAADLAAHYSRGRGNRRVPVVMVPSEELQRIPGAAPGTVRHRGGSVLWGEPQRALSLLMEQKR